MERFADIKKIYEKHLELELERMSDPLKEIEAFIKGILKSEHPISIRIDVEEPEKTEKYEDSCDRAEREQREAINGFKGFGGIGVDWSHLGAADVLKTPAKDSRTEPLDVTETVVLLTTLLNIRRTKLEKLRKELEELQFNINP